MLANVVYPRYTGFSELLEDDIAVTHVIDLTICYDDRTNTPWIWDILKGKNSSEIHFHYKIFPVVGTEGIKTEDWLQRRWQTKERILARHYRMVENDHDNVTVNGDAAFSVIDIGTLKSDNSYVNNNPSADNDNPYLLANTESDDGQLYRKSNGRPVTLSWKKLVLINFFYFFVSYLIFQVLWILTVCILSP